MIQASSFVQEKSLKKIHNPIVDNLISAAKPYKSNSGKSEDFRELARTLGKIAAMDINYSWRESKQRRSGPIQVLDMFSGCGGMSTGFRAVNSFGSFFSIQGAIDIDPVANRSYEINHNVVPQCENLADLAHNSDKLKSFLGQSGFDTSNKTVLIGCAPCQGFSSHRNNAGENDVRNSLFMCGCR